MSKFTESIKQRSKTIYTAVRPYGYYLVSLLFVVIIAGTTYSLVHHKDTTNTPSVNQVYQPSIGEPLPPDVNPQAQQNANTNTQQVAGESTTNYVAPKTGIDDNDPVSYWNDQWHFSATLPPHTVVSETKDQVNFAAADGQNYYSVNFTSAGKETLADINTQLKLSPDIKSTNLAADKLNFTTASQQGQVVISNNTIYYLLGSKYLESFQTNK
jgi:hypothetical protein